jgi:hypothetical protein
MKILITGVGGPTPRSFSIALKKYSRYKTYELIATDINPLSMGLYQSDLFNKSYVIPRCNDASYWDIINEIVRTNQVELAVILPELEVIEWSKRAEEGKLPCKALLPGSKIAGLLVDKAKMTELLDSLDLVPPSVEFDRNIIDFSSVFNKLGADFWVRSSNGTSGLGSLKVDGVESLKNWIQINPGVKTFLASVFLPGRNLACKLLYFEGKLIRSACAERINYIMAKVAPSGITGNTSFGRLLNEPKLVEVATKAMDELFKVSGSPKHGFFTVDFKEDADGTPFITEVNVRHVAFTQCFAAGGANFAEDTIRIMDEDPNYNYNYNMYEFEKGLIFLRDVDSLPIMMREENLLKL